MTSIQPADARIAAVFLTDALRIDSNYVAARARLAHCHEIFFESDGLDEADKTAALQHARVVTASDTDDATALAVAAFVLNLVGGEQEAALTATERALALNPSCATALYFGALMYGFAARPAEAIANANRALRLSPFDPAIFQAHLALGFAAIVEGRYDEGAAHCAKAVQANTRFGFLVIFHAEALALAGRMEEAAPIARRGMEMIPFYRIGLLSAFGWAPGIADKMIAGARLLGLPE
jgi:tetratricopeptide (TPR) repeat protein